MNERYQRSGTTVDNASKSPETGLHESSSPPPHMKELPKLPGNETDSQIEQKDAPNPSPNTLKKEYKRLDLRNDTDETAIPRRLTQKASPPSPPQTPPETLLDHHSYPPANCPRSLTPLCGGDAKPLPRLPIPEGPSPSVPWRLVERLSTEAGERTRDPSGSRGIKGPPLLGGSGWRLRPENERHGLPDLAKWNDDFVQREDAFSSAAE